MPAPPKYLIRCMSSRRIGEPPASKDQSKKPARLELKTVSLADVMKRRPAAKKKPKRQSSDRYHIYLKPKERRGQTNWSSILRAAVYDSFEAALADAKSLSIEAFQIVPVGYVGPPYWESSKHVRHTGSMAQYRNPRVFLIDQVTGERIEV